MSRGRYSGKVLALSGEARSHEIEGIVLQDGVEVQDGSLAILILHGMGPPHTWLKGVADVELMFPTYGAGSRYLVHSGRLPLPRDVATFPFSAVIMTSTFMDRVVENGLSGNWIRQYDFLKTSGARKIVFPQDDYWQCEVRDQFYVDWGIDEVYPVCPPQSWPELIPRCLKSGARVAQGYTTYVTPYMRSLSLQSRPWPERDFDVVYRASRTPTAPNRLGMVKSVIGDRFVEALGPNSELKLDIGGGSGAMIVGSAWHDFVGNSRAILGSNSGSSIRLRNAAVARNIVEYQLRHPGAGLEKVEQDAVPQEDRGKSYTAISPRNVEAAMLNTLQILVPGAYSGILQPYEHYIPLDEDCANAGKVVEALKDEAYCRRIIDACRDRILADTELSVECLIRDVLGRIRTHAGHAEVPGGAAFDAMAERYKSRIRFSEAKSRYLTGFKNMLRPLLSDRLKLWLRTMR